MNDMKITGISVKDYLIIKELNLSSKDISSKLNMFVGKNRSGKTSVIKAVVTGLLGTTDPSIIRQGADKTEIQIDLAGLEEQLKIQRVVTKNGQRLKVTTGNGDIKANPQTYLNSLIANYSFDPFAFVSLEGKTRKNYLLELFNPKATPEIVQSAGVAEDVLARLDFAKDGLTVLNDAYNILYASRGEINKQIKPKEEALKVLTTKLDGFNANNYRPELYPELEKQISELEKQISSAKTLQEQADKNKILREDLERKISAANTELQEIQPAEELDKDWSELDRKHREIENEIRRLNEKLGLIELAQADKKELAKRRIDLALNLESWNTTLQAVEIKDIPDVLTLNDKLAELTTRKDKALADKVYYGMYCEAEDLKPECATLNEKADKLTKTLAALKKDLPEKIVKDANIPVEGLSFDGDQVMVNGVSLDNFSTQEQVSFALNVVRELCKAKKLKALLLDRAESLDNEQLAEFVKQIEPDEFQYLITRVHNDGQPIPDNAFLVENGKVSKNVDKKQGELL